MRFGLAMKTLFDFSCLRIELPPLRRQHWIGRTLQLSTPLPCFTAPNRHRSLQTLRSVSESVHLSERVPPSALTLAELSKKLPTVCCGCGVKLQNTARDKPGCVQQITSDTNSIIIFSAP